MRTISLLLVTLLLPSVAIAEELPGEVSEVAEAAPPRSPSRERRTRVADPLSTRGAVSVVGGVTGWSASALPFLDEEATASAEANAGSLSVDLYGRRVGFHLGLGGSMSESAQSEEISDPRLRYTSGEARLAFTGTLWNSYGVFVGVGPGVEARATGIADAEGSRMASWESVVAGGDLRARFFVGRHVIVSGSAFAGVMPLAGEWQALDSTDGATAGQMDSLVFAGNVAASLRPAEWIALHGGVAMREATHRVETGEIGGESTLRPYVGLELLY